MMYREDIIQWLTFIPVQSSILPHIALYCASSQKKCYEAVPEKSCEKVLDEKARVSLAEVAVCAS